MPIETRFGFSSTAAEVLEGIDLHGKTVIVTGGASGIGTETTRALAAAGAAVTIAARRVDAAEEVAAALRSDTGNKTITVRPLDLGDLKSVHTFVQDWSRRSMPWSTMPASWPCPRSCVLLPATRCNLPPII